MIIDLENPFLPAWVPLDRKELWFNVETVKRSFPARARDSSSP